MLDCRCLPALVGALLLAPPAPAQVDPFDAQDATVHAWPTSGFGTGPATRVLTGYVTNNRRLDVLVLRGTELFLAHSPGDYRSFIPVPGTHTQVELVESVDDADPDRILTIGPTGLKVHDYVDGAFVSTTLDDRHWGDATDLVVADFDADRTIDVLAVRDDGTELLFLHDALTATPSATSWPLAAPPLDIEVFDFQGDADQEIAIATATTFDVYDRTGTSVFGLSGLDLSETALLRFEQSGYAKDRLALLATAAVSDYQWLAVLGPTLEAAVPLGAGQTFSMSRARLDPDGRDDLVLLSHLVGLAFGVENQVVDPTQNTTPTFPGAFFYSIDLGIALAPETETGPVAGDFDADGDLDLAHFDASPGSEALRILPNTAEDPAPQKLRLDDDETGLFVLDEIGPVATFEFDWLPPTAPLPNATHVEWTLWLQAAGSATASGDGVELHYQDFDPSAQAGSVSLLLDEPSLDLADAYLVEGRLVRLDAANRVVDGGPTFQATFTPGTPTASPVGDPGEVIQVFVNPAQAAQGGQTAPGLPEPREDSVIVPAPKGPDFDDEPPLPKTD